MIPGKQTLNGCEYVGDSADVHLEQAHAVAILLQTSLEYEHSLSGRIVVSAARAVSVLIECAAIAARRERVPKACSMGNRQPHSG